MLGPIFNIILQLFTVLSILSIIIWVRNSDGNDEHFGMNFLWKPLRWLRHWILQRWNNRKSFQRSWSGYFTQGIGETLDHASFSVYWSPSCKNPALTGHCLLQTDTYHKYKFKCENHWWPYRKYEFKYTYPIPLEIHKIIAWKKMKVNTAAQCAWNCWQILGLWSVIVDQVIVRKYRVYDHGSRNC